MKLSQFIAEACSDFAGLGFVYLRGFAGPFTANQYGESMFTANADGSPPNTTHAAISDLGLYDYVSFESAPHALVLSVQYDTENSRPVTDFCWVHLTFAGSLALDWFMIVD
jgi:hypothetical protein